MRRTQPRIAWFELEKVPTGEESGKGPGSEKRQGNGLSPRASGRKQPCAHFGGSPGFLISRIVG